MSAILVKCGEFRNKPVVNQFFTLVKGFHTLKKGNYVTVKNNGRYKNVSDEIKIKVDSIADIEFINEATMNTPNENEESNVKEPIVEVETKQESDEEAMDRIAGRFSILDEMTKAAIAGDIRAMIVSGPPGVGKSFGVETQLEKYSLFEQMINARPKYEIVKGALTPIGLYATLFKNSDHRNVLVFDDSDTVFDEVLSLNLLKAALDSGKRRRISWNSDSNFLRRDGIPDTFDFNGSIIFITNMDFQNCPSKKLQPHLDALQSRCHYLDLSIKDERDRMLRIKQVHRDAQKFDNDGLFVGYDFQNNESAMIMDYMWNNRSNLREISLRMALKIADLVKITPERWQALAQSTVMRNK